MELYSPIFGKVYLDKIRPHLAIVVTTDKEQGDFKEEFLYDGRYGMNGECMLFPSKSKTTWEGFILPCEFKDGDIIADEHGNIAIYKGAMWYNKKLANYYCGYRKLDNKFLPEPKRDGHFGLIKELHYATEEEKTKLFDVIKANGYKWNKETKTLEKLSKFKIGDWVIHHSQEGIIYQVEKSFIDGTYRIVPVNDKIGKAITTATEDAIRLWTIQDAKAGDVLATNWHQGDNFWEKIVIFKKYHNDGVEGYGNTFKNGKLAFCEEVPYYSKTWTKTLLPATSEQRDFLFQNMKDAGYKWNTKMKTLEKLIIPKFKVGNEIVKRNSISNSWIVSSVSSEYYGLKLPKGCESIGVLPVSEQDDWELVSDVKPKFKVGDKIRHKDDKTRINTIKYIYHDSYGLYGSHLLFFKEQDQYELVPNKFDINTLKPFDKVLVRTKNFTNAWTIDFYDGYYPNRSNFTPFGVSGGNYFQQCIPYEGNEYLRGTTNDCDDFYKNWE